MTSTWWLKIGLWWHWIAFALLTLYYEFPLVTDGFSSQTIGNAGHWCFSLLFLWTSSWIYRQVSSDLRRHGGHYLLRQQKMQRQSNYYMFLAIYSNKQHGEFVVIILIIHHDDMERLSSLPALWEWNLSIIDNLWWTSCWTKVVFLWLKATRCSCDVTVMMLSNYLGVCWIRPGPAWWPEANTGCRELDQVQRPGREDGSDRARTHCNTLHYIYIYTLHHLNGNVDILMKFSSLVALEVVILRNSGVASDENSPILQRTPKRHPIARPKWQAMMYLSQCVSVTVLFWNAIYGKYTCITTWRRATSGCIF